MVNPRRLSRAVVLPLVLASVADAAAALAQTTLTDSFSVTHADPTRSAFDVGGAWNGSADVTASTGDTVSVTLGATGDTAFDLTLDVTLPAGFTYVAGTASGLPGIAASQSGTTVTVAIPADTDLNDGESLTIDLGLVAGATVTGGTYAVTCDFGYGTTDGATDGTHQVTGNVLVREGASTIHIDPVQQSRAIGDVASWTVVVTNTGLGGLFDVEIDESALFPNNTAGSLALASMAQTAPALGATGSAPTLTLPYLAPGEAFEVQVTADVLGCQDIVNVVLTDDRTGATASSISGQVALDLTEPLIALDVPGVALDFDSAVTFSGSADNLGPGVARGLSISTNLSDLGLDVSGLGAGWSYAGGVFTLTANGGDLDVGVSQPLVFDLAASDACAASGPRTLYWNPSYTNACGDPYAVPLGVSSVTDANDRPSLGLSVSASASRLEVGDSGTFTVTLDASAAANVATDPVVVTVTLPAEIDSATAGATPGGTSVSCPSCGPGATLQWTIGAAALAGAPLSLDIDFVASSDPCDGGQTASLGATVSATSVVPPSGSACALGDTGSAFVLLTNAPGGPITQAFNVGTAPDGNFETGLADDGDAVREPGEGDFIPYTASYGFGAPFAGTWAGSTFVDDFGGLTGQTVVDGTVLVTLDGGSTVAVPSGSISGGTGSLTIDLAFLAGGSYFNDANVAGHTLDIAYETTVPDAMLSGESRSWTQRVTFELGSGTGGASSCGLGTYVQGAFVSASRAAGRITASAPSIVDVCETIDVTLNVDSAAVETIHNVGVTLLVSGTDYEYVAGQTPVYGGVFASTAPTYAENPGSNPTWQLGSASTELTGAGTITVQVRRRANAGTAATGLSAQLDYDDEQTSLDAPRDFTATGSWSPGLVREASLNLTVTPQSVTVTDTLVQWTLYVTNGGTGTAYGATLVDTLPTGLTPNAGATDTANGGGPAVSVAGQTMTWALGDLGPGATSTITLVADVSGATCSIPSGANSIQAAWGCDGVQNSVRTSTDPDFSFLEGRLQVLHDTTNSYAVLCEPAGTITIVARNTGSAHLLDVEVSEDLDTATSGVSYVSGAVEVSTDGATWAPAAEPQIAGSVLTWTQAEIAALADLAPQIEAGGTSTVYLRFPVAASESANSASASIVASGVANDPCGNGQSWPGTPFGLEMRRPEVLVQVTGRNVTTGSASGERVVADVGDSVEWTIRIDNSAGGAIARNARLVADFPASGTTSGTLTFPGGGTATIDDGAVLSIDDVAAGGVDTYTVTYVLGGTAVNENFVGTVTWGCTDNGAAAASNLSSPIDNSDPAALVMRPDFSGPGLTATHASLGNGRVEVRVALANDGATASSLQITETLPAGWAYDTTFTPTVTGTPTGVTAGGSSTVPVFSLTGDLANGESGELRFRIRPTAAFDTASDPFVNPETPGNGLDPALPGSGTHTLDLDCVASDSTPETEQRSPTFDPRTPDLDIAIDTPQRIVSDSETVTVRFTITNDGDAGSVAEHVIFTPQIAGGWTASTVDVVVPGTGGTGGVCGGVCTALQLGSLSQGQSAIVDITVTASDNGASLALDAEVAANLFLDDGATDTGSDVSLDAAGLQAVGMVFAHSLLATSESDSAGSDVLVGEEVTLRTTARLFGGEALGGIQLRASLPAALGYVSHATGPQNTATISGTSGTTPVQAGTVEFDVAALGGGVGTVEVDLVARVLNVGLAGADTVVAPVGLTFDAFGNTYASDDPADGYGGDFPDLHGETSLTARVPSLTLTHELRNDTDGQTTFGGTATGDAGDRLRYRVTVTNDGDGPAYDLSLVEGLGTAKLELVDGAADGLDNDGDGLVDGGDPEGDFTPGAAGSVTFDEDDRAALGKLDPGQSVTLLVLADVGLSATPDEVLGATLDLVASSLDGASGSQSASAGTPGDADGELVLTDAEAANVTVRMIQLAHTLVETSLGGDASADLVVGEQALLRISVVLPEAEVPSFTLGASIPAGYALVETRSAQFGSAVPSSAPTVTPGTLPASGAPLSLGWDFGTRQVAAGTDAERTVTVDYVVQVQNDAGNVEGTTLEASAFYAFTGSSANAVAQTSTVREPVVTIVQTVVAETPTDAGAELTYDVTVMCTSTAAAYDLGLVATLDAGQTYVAGSTVQVLGDALLEPDVSGATLTWARDRSTPQDVDLAGGGVLRFQYRTLLADSVAPRQSVGARVDVDWTSLDGAPGPDLGGASLAAAGATLGERTGDGSGANDQAVFATASEDVADVFAVALSRANGSLTGGAFRVGDLVTFTVAATLQEGTTPAARVELDLPSGLAFESAEAPTPASGGTFTYVAPTGGAAPMAGDTGALGWDFGPIVNAGDDVAGNNTLTLVVHARILDTGGVAASPTDVSLDADARLVYEDAGGTGRSTGDSTASVRILQPELTAALAVAPSQASPVEAGDAVDFVATLTNGGDGPALGTELEAVLPSGLRGGTPSVVAATLGGAPVTLGPPAWNASTGTAVWTLTDAQVLGASEALEVTLRATAEADLGAALTLTASGRARAYHSKEAADLAERRTYAATAPGTGSIGSEAPTDITLALAPADPNVGAEATWTVTIPGTAVGTTLHDVTLADVIPAGLTVVGVTSNAATLGTTFTGSTTGNSLDYTFAAIAPGQQGVVDVVVRVDNALGNQTSTMLSNTASYTFASTSGGGVATAPIVSSASVLDVAEPEVAVDLAFREFVVSDAIQGLQAGDRVVYDVTLTNGGDGAAHDLVLEVLADADLITPAVTADPDDPGAPTTVGPSGGTSTHTWQIAGPIPAGGTYRFQLSLTLAGTVSAQEELTAGSSVTWTSVAGASPFERTGDDGVGGALDDYAADDPTPVTVTTGNVALTLGLGGGGGTDYAPGEVVTYELALLAGEGVVDDLRIEDALPAGLVFVDATFTTTNYAAAGGGAVSLAAQPSAGDTGTLVFDFGSLESTAPGPRLDLVIRAYVDDVPANVAGADLINDASAVFADPQSAGATLVVAAQTTPTVTVAEPDVLVGFDGPTDADLAEDVTLVLRAENAGSAAGWAQRFVCVLPEGMRVFDPTAGALGVSVAGGRTLTFVSGTDYTATWDGGAGQLEIALQGANGFLDAGETLRVECPVRVDEFAADGATLTPVATLIEQDSVDLAGGAVSGARTYTTALGGGTLGTAAGDAGDDAVDDAPLIGHLPVLAVVKAVDQTLVAPAEVLHYTLTLTNTGSADTAAATLADELDADLFPGTLANVTVTPPVGNLVVDATGGVNGTGRVELSGLVLGAGSSVTVEFDATVTRPLADGTTIVNQATFDVPGFGTPRVSDSANPADDDGVETGNDPGDGDDDDPTVATVGAYPLIELSKTAVDVNGAPLEPGDVLRYTLSVENVGTENTATAMLIDAIPSRTTYVAGSTTVDGAPALDVQGTSPLVGGLSLASPGSPAGRLVVDEPVAVTFDVRVDDGLEDGAIVANSAWLQHSGEASGPRPDAPSDDPSTSTSGDPTLVVVGAAELLDAVKTSTDVNGGTLEVGDELLYAIEVTNAGAADAPGVVLVDALPAGLTYVAGSLELDLGGSVTPLTDAADGDGADFGATAVDTVTLDIGTLAAGTAQTLRFRASVDVGVAAGTPLVNQGVLRADGRPDEPTDADGDDTNGDQPTVDLVGAAPLVRVTKSVVDLDGSAVLAGDVLEYTLLAENLGTVAATGLEVTDLLDDPLLVYVTGSTTLDGVALADGLGGVSPLVGGLTLGTLDAGAQRTVRVRVTVAGAAQPGEAIDNQATWTSADAGSGVSDSPLDDGVEDGNDPADGDDDDPTRVWVGGAPGSATVSGLVWNDTDHDRVFGPGEEPREGWVVELLLVGNGSGAFPARGGLGGLGAGALVASTTTLTDGTWTLSGILPGDGYALQFRHPETGTVFGNPVSSAPGTSTQFGAITGLTLSTGTNVVDQNLPLDPSGVVYDAYGRTPIAGAVVTMDGPVGFDPVLHLPPGQQGQSTGADGFYRFDLLGGFPAGAYTIQIAPPGGYFPTFPSTTIAPAAGPLDPTGQPDPFLVVPGNGAPQTGDPTTYYVDFDLASGDPNVLNNHIPLDPILEGAIVVTKRAAKGNVLRGELVPYTIEVRNTLAVDLPDALLVDALPPGFKYVEGSATLVGLPIEPEIVGGRTLRIPNVPLVAGETVEARLILVVGAGVGDGRYVNRAWTVDPISAFVTSNVATAETLVVPDPLFDCSDVLGKVFEDRNGNGYQDPGEPGLAGVRVVTARGLVITTDAFGRYHIACPEVPDLDRGSNFIVKLDPRSLPEGYALTSENPRVVRLTRGKIVEANFGVAPVGVLSVTLPERDENGALPAAFDDALRVALEGTPSPSVMLRFEGPGDAACAAEAEASARRVWAELGRDGELAIERRVVLGTVGAATSEALADRVTVSVDGGDATPRLNLTATPDGARRGEPVRFQAWSNYWAFVERAEVRVFALGDSAQLDEPLAVLPLDGSRGADWTPVDPEREAVTYVLRVVDAEGRYDETRPRDLAIVSPRTPRVEDAPLSLEEVLLGYGGSNIGRQRIPIGGATVTVRGTALPDGATVLVAGQPVPLDARGSFADQAVLPAGDQTVDVAVLTADGGGIDVRRRVTVADEGWFWVALADLTVGGGGSTPEAEALTGDERYDESVWASGRVALYLKGKLAGDTLLTVAFDTGEQNVEDLFRSLDDTDPRQLLRYIDPDQHYPVYGDDSTTVEDAPTNGRLYVRLERGDDRVVLGNTKVTLLQNELAPIDRAVYGLHARWNEDVRMENGDARTEIEVFGAQPETAAAYEELRGTGGSLYYLEHTELVIGSERLRIEVRDKDSGILLETRNLSPQQDYDIDYLAGRVLLTRALPSVTGDGFVVQNGSLAGNPVFLVARYEYETRATDLDATNAGGRAQRWLGEDVRVGVTAEHQIQTGADRDLVGVDVLWQAGEKSYVKAEVGASDGPGNGVSTSANGGFGFVGQSAGNSHGSAVRVETRVALEETGIGLDGEITAVAEHRDGGYSAPGRVSGGDVDQVSVSYVESFGADARLTVDVDHRDEAGRSENTALEAQYEDRVDDDWKVGVGVRRDDVDGLGFTGTGSGARSDAAVRLTYDAPERWSAYGFGQGTLERSSGRSANNRYGVGGAYEVNERLETSAEISGGNGGLGARVGTEWRVNDRTDLYLAYGLDADRTDLGLGGANGQRSGALTLGARRRFTDTFSVYGEEKWQHGDGPVGLTHVQGLEYSPNDRWTGSMLIENGQLADAFGGGIERTGVSVDVGYVDGDLRTSGAVEWRSDENGSGERDTWLVRSNTAYRIDDDWRLLGGGEVARSNATGGGFANAEFAEFSIGAAYRPTEDDRWNALFRYTYREDVPSPGQVTSFGVQADYAQRSHVLAADANYDLNRWVTVGGKVGLRTGEVRSTKTDGPWFDSTALLYVLRADVHVVESWDVLLEGRSLDVDTAGDRRVGILAAIHRHLGDNAKLGIGYNFADFSDDLTDLSYRHQGWFLNLVGKF